MDMFQDGKVALSILFIYIVCVYYIHLALCSYKADGYALDIPTSRSLQVLLDSYARLRK